MSDPTGAICGSDRSHLLMAKLADMLGCSRDGFLEPSSCDLGQTSELLRLWLSIEETQDRAALLAHMRGVAEKRRS